MTEEEKAIDTLFYFKMHFAKSDILIKCKKICAIIGEEEQQPKTMQEKQAESEKYQKAFDDGYENGYAQARFDYGQEPCEGMRDATEEERESTKDYIDSISKPTGLQFDDIYEELDFVQPHNKISANLQPCEDCISRETAIDQFIHWYSELLLSQKEEVSFKDILKSLPPVTPSIPDVENNFNLGYNCGYADAMSDIAESEGAE